MLGWALFVPVGFVLDPVFDRIGSSLLQAVSLRPLWTTRFNMPLMPYTNFNNAIVLGSVVAWLVLAVPIYFAAKYGVARYRATLGARVRGCASRVSNASVDLGALQVADPFDPRKNLIEADGILLKLNPEALVEKKVVIEQS